MLLLMPSSCSVPCPRVNVAAVQLLYCVSTWLVAYHPPRMLQLHQRLQHMLRYVSAWVVCTLGHALGPAARSACASSVYGCKQCAPACGEGELHAMHASCWR